MKKKLFLVSILVCSLAQAGPFVSGGTPDHVNCGDKSSIYQVAVTVLGASGAGRLLKATPTGFLPFDVNCVYKNQMFAALPGTTLQYECGTKSNPNGVKIYKSTNPVQRWAVVLPKSTTTHTSPVTLKCE